ncbi:unnamed protein product [Schistosoma mattheei]|uniref:Uncharacterized protein n=1 Tax=Schistosoma mattheei TaxID=31246 RepID=A0A183P9A7_9TREM|nr:unnamed protein product [Schistosoma mattheei]
MILFFLFFQIYIFQIVETWTYNICLNSLIFLDYILYSF